MSLARLILSRLLGNASDEEEKDNLVSEAQGEQEEEALPARLSLDLPSGHPVNRLFSFWSERDTPGPELYLDGLSDGTKIFSEGELEREMDRLRRFVTATAEKRLKEAETAQEAGLEKEESQSGEETSAKPLPDLHAQAVIFTSKNQMAAWLLVYPPVRKGKDISRDMLVQALKENEVNFGVDEILLDHLPNDTERYFRLFLAAEGIPPVHGKDGYVTDRFPREKRRVVSINESGQVNYSELHIVNNADKGDIICQIVEPVAGVPGRTVFDKEIPAKDGKKAAVPKGRNTELSEDGSCLTAAKPGHVEFDGRNFQVKPVMEIGKNVDYSTGNINFLGDIHIRGDVCSGFTVRAMGNITVDGVVEASTVEAGGDLVVVKGVKGNNEAVIKACGSVYAKYLESSFVCVKEELHSDCIINCNIYSDGMIQACSGRGIIIGGRICAAREVKANVIGSKSECTTSVILGGNPSDDFEYESLLREIEELESEFEELEKQPESPAKVRRLPMVRMKLSVDRNKLRQFETYIKGKEEPQDQEWIQDERCLVCETAYPGTEVTIGDVTQRLGQEVQHCRAVLAEGEIHFI